MGKRGFLRRLWYTVSRPRRRGFAPNVDSLEGRTLQAVYGGRFVINIHPAVLPPTGGQYVPVHVYGTIADNKIVPISAFFFVTDEYRRDEPSGTLTLGPPVKDAKFAFYDYAFDFTIHLQAQRGSGTMDGRHYDIFIGAKDKDNTDGKTAAVYVPLVYPQVTPAPHAHVLKQAKAKA